MGTRALAVLFLVPSLAVAQASVAIVSELEISRLECAGTTESVSITFTINVPGGDRYDLFAQKASCSATQEPSATPIPVSNVVGTSEQTIKVSPDALQKAVGTSSCASATDITYYVCVYLVSGSTVLGAAISDGSSKFQLAVPPRPAISAAPANSAIDVTVTPGTIDTTYTATASISYEAIATPTAGGNPVSSGRKFGTSLRIENLTNGTDYSVVAYAYSSALNPGPVSNTVSPVTPKDFADFWRNYENAGGREQGGCGGGAGALSPLALLPLALRLRRRRA